MALTNIRDLFLSHQRELQIYLTRLLGDADVAGDLTQETFLRVTQYAQQNSSADVTHIRPYLYRIAHNLAVDHVRAQKRNPVKDGDADKLESVVHNAPSPEQIVGGQSELEFVRRALRELPERTREIFVLVRMDGLTYRQTAQRLGISDSSVQKHVARAIAFIMARIRENQAE